MSGGLAIVLSGGGAKGAFQVGALKALIQKHKVDFETVVGTSSLEISDHQLRAAPRFGLALPAS